MRDYWLTQDLLQAAGIGFIFLALAGIGLALWLPKKWWGKLLAALVVGFLIAIPVRKAGKEMKEEAQEQQALEKDYKERYAKAKALFDERCKTAGEKVYRTVENVEGVLLLNVRGTDIARERTNPLWPDAALPDEHGGDQYIRHFLYWEHESSSTSRGYLNPDPVKATSRGYRFVDLKQPDETVLRYRLKNPGNRDSAELVSERLNGKSSRYAIGFVNQVNPEDRAHWVAGTTITLTDTQTNEVIATRESYSFEPGLGSRAGDRQPWGFAVTCPRLVGWNERYPTRFFSDQVLKPTKGE